MSAGGMYGIDGAGLATTVGMIVAMTLERVARLLPLERAKLVERAGNYACAKTERDQAAAVLEVDDILRRIERREWAASVVGARIREKRLAGGMSQQALAKRSQIPQSHISRIETGRHKPGWITLVRIAAGLRISILELHPLGEQAEAVTREPEDAET